MKQETVSSAQLKRWAAAIRAYRWETVAVLLLDVFQVWGFIGGQFLWMLSPFFGKETLAPYAEFLEQPE